MATFRDILISTENQLIDAAVFCGHGYDSEHDEAVALVLAAASLSPLETGTEVLDAPYPTGAHKTLANFLTRRCEERLPVAYITGQAWLGPLCFKSDNRALVPRSPVAELILNQLQPWYESTSPSVIIDVCCGGGSLGMLAKWVFPDSKVLLSDIDADAIGLARDNATLHNVDAIVRADLLAWCADESVDVILANPPYVDAQDMRDLPQEYLHEPGLALSGGEDGLDLVRLMLVDAARILRSGGILILEVGNSIEALEGLSPMLAPLWVELEQGGHGVAVFMAQDLAQWAAGKANAR